MQLCSSTTIKFSLPNFIDKVWVNTWYILFSYFPTAPRARITSPDWYHKEIRFLTNRLGCDSNTCLMIRKHLYMHAYIHTYIWVENSTEWLNKEKRKLFYKCFAVFWRFRYGAWWFENRKDITEHYYYTVSLFSPVTWIFEKQKSYLEVRFEYNY